MKQKIKHRKLYANMTIPERIEHLKKESEKLEKTLSLYKYFYKIRKLKNSYIVEMRKLVALDLKAQGYSLQDICKVLSKSHATILNLFLIESLPEVKIVAELEYKSWIQNNKVPKIKRKLIPDHTQKTAYRSVLWYYLVEL